MMGNIKNFSELKKMAGSDSWQINISPGTKAQAFSLAQLKGVSLWSLENLKQQSVPLAPGINKPMPYNFPPIELLGFAGGGSFLDAGISKSEIESRLDFLKYMAEIVANFTYKDFDSLLGKEGWRAGMEIKNRAGKIVCKAVEADQSKMIFQVTVNGITLEGLLKGPPKEGFWLEEIVAGAFLEAGGKDIEDMRTNIRWAWPNQRPGNNAHRTELDMAIIWNGEKKGAIVAVSCKLVIKKENVEQNHREIVAEARANFGRFALPVIVRGGISHRDPFKHACERIEQKIEPLEIDLRLINKPNKLRELIEISLINNRTTQVSP